MLYEQVLDNFKRLKEKLTFQERRNFFNKRKDDNLNKSIKIIDSVIDKMNKYELSYKDLSDLIKIAVKIIALLDITDKDVALDVKSLLKSMSESTTELEKQYYEMLKE